MASTTPITTSQLLSYADGAGYLCSCVLATILANHVSWLVKFVAISPTTVGAGAG